MKYHEGLSAMRSPSLPSCPLWLMSLCKADGLALNDRVLQELRVVVGGEIGPVVGAAAFLARQGGLGDEQRGEMDVLSFLGAPSVRVVHPWGDLFQTLNGSLQTRSSAHDAHVLPHQILDFADDFLRARIHRPVGIGGTRALRHLGRCMTKFLAHLS